LLVTASVQGGLLTVVSDTPLLDAVVTVTPYRFPSVPYYRSPPYSPRTIGLGFADPSMLKWLYIGGGYRQSINPSYSAFPASPTPSDLKAWCLDPLVESCLVAYATGLRADFNSAALRLVYSGSPQLGIVSLA
jgi:hypothetical protein